MADEKKIKGKPFKCSDELYVSEKKLKEELTKEREKAAYNEKVQLAFTFVWMACLAAKLWWLK